jgi:aminoglycoside phosphotransferase (APT) family kinase protein
MRPHMNHGQGPDVFQRAQAHRPQDAVLALERTLKVAVATIDRSGVGSSHAVYLVDLEDGRRCVARFATHAEHHLEREVWASERCRQAGLPVPRVLAADLRPTDHSPPLAVYEHMPGEAGDRVALLAQERTAVLTQMSGIAARLHRFKVPGTGELVAHGNGYAGTAPSWAAYVQATLERRMGRLSARALPQDLAGRIRRLLEVTRPALEMAVPPGAPSSALVHGDLRLQNTLLMRPTASTVRVSALLDFEMVLAGDGLLDLAWLACQDGRAETDLVGILRGYGAAASDVRVRQRLWLYQVSYALEHLWWLEGFEDDAGMARVHERILPLLGEDSA